MSDRKRKYDDFASDKQINQLTDIITQSKLELDDNKKQSEHNRIEKLKKNDDEYFQMMNSALEDYNKLIAQYHEIHANNINKINQEIDNELKEHETKFVESIAKKIDCTNFTSDKKILTVHLERVEFPFKLYVAYDSNVFFALKRDYYEERAVITDNKEKIIKANNILIRILSNYILKRFFNKVIDNNFKFVDIIFIDFDKYIDYLDLDNNCVIRIAFNELLEKCKIKLYDTITDELNINIKIEITDDNKIRIITL